MPSTPVLHIFPNSFQAITIPFAYRHTGIMYFNSRQRPQRERCPLGRMRNFCLSVHLSVQSFFCSSMPCGSRQGSEDLQMALDGLQEPQRAFEIFQRASAKGLSTGPQQRPSEESGKGWEGLLGIMMGGAGLRAPQRASESLSSQAGQRDR